MSFICDDRGDKGSRVEVKFFFNFVFLFKSVRRVRFLFSYMLMYGVEDSWFRGYFFVSVRILFC